MKQIIVFLLFISLAFVGQAQVKTMLGSNGLARDTVSNAGTETWTASVARSKTVGIIVAVTKISGTVGGAITIKGSPDGTNYYTIASSSQTPSDASANYGWEFTDPKWAYYQVSYTGTGTMSASAIAKVIAR